MGIVQDRLTLFRGNEKDIKALYRKALRFLTKSEELSKDIVAKPFKGWNGYTYMVVFPCGSKLGWPPRLEQGELLAHLDDRLGQIEVIDCNFGDLLFTAEYHDTEKSVYLKQEDSEEK